MNTSVNLNSVLAFQKTVTIRPMIRVGQSANERLTVDMQPKQKEIMSNNSDNGRLTSR